MTAIKTAQAAADAAFLTYLDQATAAMYVPDSVIDAANAAYIGAGGKGKIEVKGHGNRTHPVCGVSVRKAK